MAEEPMTLAIMTYAAVSLRRTAGSVSGPSVDRACSVPGSPGRRWPCRLVDGCGGVALAIAVEMGVVLVVRNVG
jgi:hypothetical protein